MDTDERLPPPDMSQIREWRSILTLIVFIITNTVVSFPFHIPIPVPRVAWNAFLGVLARVRIIPPRDLAGPREDGGRWKVLRWSISTIMAPVYACLFLLATLAIGRDEVHDGTVGSNNIDPYDVMIFFITLAYIAISIDASGLLKYLAFRVLKKAGAHGRRLFLYLFWFFFALGTAIGNDPIVLSGTSFLAYMIRASSNIASARAWIFSQFAVANISSAILVSSNPTNLVLAAAFQIKFIDYTANMIVPVIITAAVLFPCLLFIVFRDEKYVPRAIDMHELSDAEREREPVNPNVPYAGYGEDRTPVGEILNPYLDRRHATYSVSIMAATLISVLLINAITASRGGHPTPVMYVTMPASFLCLCADLFTGWRNRAVTRAVAQRGRTLAERDAVERDLRAASEAGRVRSSNDDDSSMPRSSSEGGQTAMDISNEKPKKRLSPWHATSDEERAAAIEGELNQRQARRAAQPTTLVSMAREAHAWWRETFPAASIVLSRLPFALVPFAFAMFILVEALVRKGWVSLFAYGWDEWVRRTGIMGAISGMGFLGVFLSNFTGTNIGTTILLCRIIQAWVQITQSEGRTISDRTFWGSVYSMALGVNFGAFGSVFCASLAGLLWRDILASKGVIVRRIEFLCVNAPIIGIATAVGCTVLAGEIYIMRKDEPYVA
ncbi:arsenite efflux transporter [Colletotrichum graminicola]|uniref:Arsenite efflux transporter n=1 Tax=Colletotrichum graminicola (strain M1.001 / M2 / FGSC 10212) TaxID=645133 RepID=E3QXH8_COLGM|nr:arsenite efflux transporter [Colletotrichum graminicola M1.001]EFQ35566.1 arsenite efflux transporter [Colletotrichum graminicola M1.001]WDK19596.1 arsenite efflux transporter [Colletotrichum graminicola]